MDTLVLGRYTLPEKFCGVRMGLESFRSRASIHEDNSYADDLLGARDSESVEEVTMVFLDGFSHSRDSSSTTF